MIYQIQEYIRYNKSRRKMLPSPSPFLPAGDMGEVITDNYIVGYLSVGEVWKGHESFGIGNISLIKKMSPPPGYL